MILVKKGIPIVIITLGKEGALITTKKFQKKIPAYDIKNIIDIMTKTGSKLIGKD